MSDPNLQPESPDLAPQAVDAIAVEPPPDAAAEPDLRSQYVKLAMRNMVRKRGISIQHFLLTVLGLLGVLVGLSYLTR